MNHRERLAICSTCINRKLEFTYGYVCGLTEKVADFQGSCKHFVRDETVTEDLKVRTGKRPFVPLFEPKPEREEPVRQAKGVKKAVTGQKVRKKKPSVLALKKLRKYQNFIYALLGGLLITLIAAVGWPFIASMTGYGGAYLALGVGLLVGLAVRYFGAGIRPVFGFLAGLLTLAASLTGYYLSLAGFPEQVQLAAILGVPEYLDTESILSTMQDSFVPLDAAFYGLAFILAWVLAIRRISKRKMARLEQESYKGAPALYRLRLPLILVLILVPAYYGYTLTSQDPGGNNTLYYDSGEKMSEGEMLNGLETGEWTSWYENGNIQSVGKYTEGQKDSLWTWYDESGNLTGTGMYDHGVEQGTWVHYYPDGVVSDSGSYAEGLMEGLWTYYHENGSLKSEVNYKAGQMHGEKTLWTSSGMLVNVEQYEDGILVENE